MDIGGRHLERMDQTAVFVHANVGLISKVPFIALFYLMRIRVPLLVLVFCRGWSCNDGRVNDSALFQKQAFLPQQLYYLCKQLLL